MSKTRIFSLNFQTVGQREAILRIILQNEKVSDGHCLSAKMQLLLAFDQDMRVEKTPIPTVLFRLIISANIK